MADRVIPYDVKINGKGYLLREGSYNKSKNPVNYDKFSSGQVSYADLTDQEAIAQSDWREGFKQKFAIRDRGFFFNSNGLEIMDDEGSFRLGRPFTESSAVLADGYAKEKYSLGGVDAWFVAGTGAQSGKLSYTTDYSTFTHLSQVFTHITDIKKYAGKMYVSNAEEKVLWASTNPTAAGSWTAEFTSSFDVAWEYMEVLGDFLYLSNRGSITRKYNGGGVSGLIQAIGANEWTVEAYAEYNGRLYMGCVERNNPNRAALRVYDGSADWTVAKWDDIEGSPFGVLIEFNGRLYFSLNRNKITSATMYSWDGQNLVEEFTIDPTRPADYLGSFDYDTITDDDNFVDSVVIGDANVANGKLFVTIQNQGSEVSPTGFTEVYCNPGNFWYRYKRFDNDYIITDPNTSTSLIGSGQRLGMFVGEANGNRNLYSTLFSGNTFEVSGKMESSMYDMDLFSIDKQVNAMESYHATMPASAVVTNRLITFAEDSTYTAETSNSVDGTMRTVLKPTSDNVAKRFQYQVELSTGQYSPIVEDVVLRYVIEPNFKKVWVMELRVYDNMEYRDGSREKRQAKEVLADLEQAIEKSTVSFVDVDGREYNPSSTDPDNKGVIIKEANVTGPYVFSEEGPEYRIALRLTEA